MRVLLGVDGSTGSEDAARVVAQLSPPEELVILTMVNVPSLAYQSAWLRIEDLATIVEKEMRKEGQAVLKRLASDLTPYAKAITLKIEKGDPGEGILHFAKSGKVDLIVLGARGLNRLSELVFGSVSHRVLSHSTCPIFVVKSPISQLTSVLIPIEGQEDANRALDFFAKKPFRHVSQVTILHAVPFAQPHWLEGALIPESYRKELMAAGENLIHQTVSKFLSLGYDADSIFLEGSPVELIFENC